MITDNLGKIKSEIKSLLVDVESFIRKNVALKQYNVNKNAEAFYEEFLTIVFGIKVINANKAQSNAKGIDLLAEKEGITFQITSDSGTEKIKDTIKKTVAEIEAGKDYKELFIVMIAGKEDYRGSTFQKNLKNKISFDKEKHILDNDDLLKMVESEVIDVFKSIKQCVKKYWVEEGINSALKNEFKLTSSLTDLVLILSSLHSPEQKQKQQHPLPEDKITHNNLKANTGLIRKYHLYGGLVMSIYDTLENNSANAKAKFKNSINDSYLRAKGEITKLDSPSIEIIRENADAIFDKTFELLKDKVIANITDQNISNEDIDPALYMIMTVGFVDCDILENPNNLIK